jgi:hypothetical protein
MPPNPGSHWQPPPPPLLDLLPPCSASLPLPDVGVRCSSWRPPTSRTGSNIRASVSASAPGTHQRRGGGWVSGVPSLPAPERCWVDWRTCISLCLGVVEPGGVVQRHDCLSIICWACGWQVVLNAGGEVEKLVMELAQVSPALCSADTALCIGVTLPSSVAHVSHPPVHGDGMLFKLVCSSS